MSAVTLQLTARDPIVARDGRPFGAGQGNRMRGLNWLLPSVVAGSFRTAFVKASDTLNFAGDMPQKLMQIEVAGVFPTVNNELYLPAPSDAVAEPTEDGKTIKQVHRVTPQPNIGIGGCDFPNDFPLQPVMLSEDQAKQDFKPKSVPAWWPLTKYAEWLAGAQTERSGDWFEGNFLNAAIQETRDHVAIDEHTGANKESQLFSTSALNLTHLPRFRDQPVDKNLPFDRRFAPIQLSVRVTVPGNENLQVPANFETIHPLGGERRLVHWKAGAAVTGWTCPDNVKSGLANATGIRMVLATPAIFECGWKPGWLDDQLAGSPPGTNVKLKLVGVSNGRWKAVSGWSLAPPTGPKPIRRMVPAGSVYFFTCEPGDAVALENCWLQSVSDEEDTSPPRNFASAQADGFGLAVWGTWKPH